MAQRNPKNPVSYFYWNDWLSDPALKICSYAAKGLWMDCLSLAATCSPFGHLSVNARPLTPDHLQVLLPGNHGAEEIAALLSELIEKGVASRTAKGFIYSRRMVKDAHNSAVARKTGKTGGNPTLLNTKKKSSKDNPTLKAPLNPNTFSLSNKINGKNETEKIIGEPELWSPRCRKFFENGFWLPDWGPKPNETGCLAPYELIEETPAKQAQR